MAITAWLDRVLYRHPFEGASARRYAAAERPAFGDFDERLLDSLVPLLDGATHVVDQPRTNVTLLDVGAGPGTFAMRAAARFPRLRVIAVDPSRDFARPLDGVEVACARGEALPIADASVDVAICLSSIRHVRDRSATLRELRRVVRRHGRLVIVELESCIEPAPYRDARGSARLAAAPPHVRSAGRTHCPAGRGDRSARPRGGLVDNRMSQRRRAAGLRPGALVIARWARRAAELHGELREVAELGVDPRWWLLAGGVALPWDTQAAYLMSDAEPAADTFIGHPTAPPRDPFVDAVVRALAARSAIRALDGRLPDQPLAVTIRRTLDGAIAEPSALGTVAFAIGERTWIATLPPASATPRALATAIATLAADLGRAARGDEPRLLDRLGSRPIPFVCVTLGDEPLATARHGHRRAWRGNGTGEGPWLGLSRAGGLAVVSTCHMIVDGFGHAWLAEEIRTRARGIALDVRSPDSIVRSPDSIVRSPDSIVRSPDVPAPAVSTGAVPLAIAWRSLDGARIPSALPLAYALGRILHRVAGRRDAAFSPTFQIPVAPGVSDNPERRRRRVVPAIASVRFGRGEPESFAAFEARTREALRREAAGSGLSTHLLAAAQGAPAPLAWKRRAVSASRPRWLDAVATLVGGRGCVSRIRLDVATRAPSPACAVSSPGRLPSAANPLGGCVVTVVDDGEAGAITLCGAGFTDTDGRATALLDELLATIP